MGLLCVAVHSVYLERERERERMPVEAVCWWSGSNFPVPLIIMRALVWTGVVIFGSLGRGNYIGDQVVQSCFVYTVDFPSFNPLLSSKWILAAQWMAVITVVLTVSSFNSVVTLHWKWSWMNSSNSQCPNILDPMTSMTK